MLQNILKFAYLFIIFGLICLLTALFFNCSTKKVLQDTITRDGMVIGPIKVKDVPAVYEIKVHHDLSLMGTSSIWTEIEGEVLDARKEYLFSFGDELWEERGFDEEGPWHESKEEFAMKVTFKNKGKYYLRMNITSPFSHINPVSVVVYKKLGSSLPFFIIGVISLVGGLIPHLVNWLRKFEWKFEDEFD